MSRVYLPTDFVDVRLSGTRPDLEHAGHGLPAVRHAPRDVLQRQLVVEQANGAALPPQRHVVMRRVVRLRRAAPEQLGGPVVERRTVVQPVAAQVARFFHYYTRAHNDRYFSRKTIYSFKRQT